MSFVASDLLATEVLSHEGAPRAEWAGRNNPGKYPGLNRKPLSSSRRYGFLLKTSNFLLKPNLNDYMLKMQKSFTTLHILHFRGGNYLL